jgi:intein/homing endonuclease
MAIASNTPVPIPGGWTLAKHLKKGDYVFSSKGLPIQIVGTHEYVPLNCYEVLLNDGVSILVDNHTRFPVSDINRRWVENQYQAKRKQRSIQKFASPEELLDIGLTTDRGDRIFSINNTAPIQFLWEDHPVPPFIAGMWMTKRNRRGRFILKPENIEFIKKKIRSYGWNYVEESGNLIEIRPSIAHAFITKYPTVPRLLPTEYCFGAIEQRIELLQGFLALRPNAYNKKRKEFEIFSTDIRFLIVIQGICESLGMKTHVFSRDHSSTHKLRFKTNIPLTKEQEIVPNLKNAGRRMITAVNTTQILSCIHIDTAQPFVAGQGFLPIWH